MSFLGVKKLINWFEMAVTEDCKENTTPPDIIKFFSLSPKTEKNTVQDNTFLHSSTSVEKVESIMTLNFDFHKKWLYYF